jgi:hypothetical protein
MQREDGIFGARVDARKLREWQGRGIRRMVGSVPGPFALMARQARCSEKSDGW